MKAAVEKLARRTTHQTRARKEKQKREQSNRDAIYPICTLKAHTETVRHVKKTFKLIRQGVSSGRLSTNRRRRLTDPSNPPIHRICGIIFTVFVLFL